MNSKITWDIQKRVQAAMGEMNDLIKERDAVIHGAWVGRVAQEHVLMLGPGGTAKSFLARSLADHITGSQFFEVAVDETTDPSQLFGPPDIKAMVEDGKTRRVPTNMLPEATDAFIDEFFNANGPLLHSIMPVLNERVWHNNGLPSPVQLRQALMGTNKLNADADQAALWDRVHLRYVVDYIQDRKAKSDMITQAIARMSLVGRGVTTNINASKTLITLDELDLAHKEALALDISDGVLELFFDIIDELHHEGIHVSNRREVEGMAAVMANAWVRGHEEVKTADLDILAHMFWSLQDQMGKARSVILAATNPGEKAALDLFDDLDALKKEMKQANDADIDESRKKKVGIEAVKNTDKLLREAREHLAKAQAAGADTAKLTEVISRADTFKCEVGEAVFGLRADEMSNMTKANA